MDCFGYEYESCEERTLINLRSREFNIIYEVSGDVNTTRCVTWGFYIQVCFFNLRDIWDFGNLFLFDFV
jgi:hypothetical protein